MEQERERESRLGDEVGGGIRPNVVIRDAVRGVDDRHGFGAEGSAGG